MAINHIDAKENLNATLFLKKQLRPQLKEFLDRLCRFVSSVKPSEHRKPLRYLDFGCGPSVWSALCVAKIADHIVFAEYVTSNRKDVYKWLKMEDGCRKWSIASAIIGDLEKISARAVEERLRRKSCSVVPCDIQAERIIQRPRKGSQSLCYYSGPAEIKEETESRTRSRSTGEEPEPTKSGSTSEEPAAEDDDIFDIVLSSCCLECACCDELSYRKAVKKLSERIASAGYLVLVGVMECPSCGPGRSFPQLSLDANIVKNAVSSTDLLLQSFETFSVPGVNNAGFYFLVARKRSLLAVSGETRV